METTILATAHASAERFGDKEIQEQHQFLSRQPVLSQVLDAIPQMICILNEHRQIVMANSLLVNTLGSSNLEKVLGTRPGELAECPHALEAEYGCGTTVACRSCGAVAAILSAQAGQTVTKDCTIQPDSRLEPIDLRVKATPMNLKDQQFTLLAMEDVGGAKVTQMLERTFFHDILNSAGGVMGLAQIMDDAEDMDEVQEYAPLLASQSEQMVDAIETQRDFLAARRGQLDTISAPVGSLTVIQATIDLYRNHQVAEGKVIARDPQAERLVVNTTKVLLQRTVGNMVKNALEACSPGRTVTLGCRQIQGDSGPAVRFEVHNGAVIPFDIQKQIFHRSFSTKGEGRGIGTYSMKLLGEKYLGGKVDFRSDEDHGTTFWIDIPLQP